MLGKRDYSRLILVTVLQEWGVFCKKKHKEYCDTISLESTVVLKLWSNGRGMDLRRGYEKGQDKPTKEC